MLPFVSLLLNLFAFVKILSIISPFVQIFATLLLLFPLCYTLLLFALFVHSLYVFPSYSPEPLSPHPYYIFTQKITSSPSFRALEPRTKIISHKITNMCL